jgi:hypothetical protein
MLSYMDRPEAAFPPPIEVLDIPEAWRYPGHPSELWYGKDCHPKPRLNGLLAGFLADTLLRPGRVGSVNGILGSVGSDHL